MNNKPSICDVMFTQYEKKKYFNPTTKHIKVGQCEDILDFVYVKEIIIHNVYVPINELIFSLLSALFFNYFNEF